MRVVDFYRYFNKHSNYFTSSRRNFIPRLGTLSPNTIYRFQDFSWPSSRHSGWLGWVYCTWAIFDFGEGACQDISQCANTSARENNFSVTAELRWETASVYFWSISKNISPLIYMAFRNISGNDSPKRQDALLLLKCDALPRCGNWKFCWFCWFTFLSSNPKYLSQLM